jgi:hypothetical protein
VQITGGMEEGGQVFVGDQRFEGAGPWTFDGSVSAGVHDVVAVGQSEVLIRHDQAMLMAFDAQPIDVSTGLTLGSVVLENDITAFSSVETELVTVNGTRVVLASAFDSASYVPAEELELGDVEVVRLGIPNAPFASQALVDPNRFQGLALDPLPGPTGEAFGGDAVSVDFRAAGFPSFPDEFRVEYSTQDGSLAATATRGWIAAHARTLAFDPTLPGFRWPIAPGASAHVFTISLRDASDTVVLQTADAD